MLIDYLPGNPFRPVDWRWHLASTLRQGGVPPRRRRRYDAWVRAAAKYQDRRDAPRRRRHDPLAAVATAHGLWSGADERLRHEVEIRLLGGQTCDDAAARIGVAAGVVEAYERLFYNVIERLRCLDYIVRVTDPAMSLFVGEPPLDVVLKRLAYCYGPAAADFLVGYLDGGIPAGVDPRLDRAIRRAILVLSHPVDEATAPTWIRLGAVIRMLEREAAAGLIGPVAMPVAVAGELPAGILDRPTIASSGVADPDLDPILLDWPMPPTVAGTGTPGGVPPRAAAG